MSNEAESTGSTTSVPVAPKTVDRSTVPWQVDWKNPTWKEYSTPAPSTPRRRKQNDRSENIVGVSTAQVQAREIAAESPSVWQLLSSATDNTHNDQDEDDHWLLTVTLLDPSGESFISSSTGNARNTQVATDILLELMHCETQEILHSRRLVWPETMGSATKQRKAAMKRSLWMEFGDVFLPWLKLDPVDENTADDDKVGTATSTCFPSDTGVVAATLCRQPLTNHRAKREEALEVISSMLVGLGPSTTAAAAGEKISVEGRSRTGIVADNEEITRSGQEQGGVEESSSSPSEPTNDPLCLVCVSSHGLICIYSIWDLLSLVAPLEEEPQESTTATSVSSELVEERAMAAWLLGAELFQQLESTWLPLSRPKTTISLSILNEDWDPPKVDPPKEDRNMDDAEHEGQQDEPNPSTPNQAITSLPPSKTTTNILVWNPWIEASTLPQRTIYNTATSVHVVGPSCPFLVVLGQGIPHNSPAISSKRRRRKRRSSVTSKEDKDTMGEELKKDDDSKGPPKEAPDAASAAERDWWRRAGQGGPTTSTHEANPLTGQNQKDDWWAGDESSEEKSAKKQPSTSIAQHKDYDSTSPLGGFVTFCSMASWSESKTLFLDFVPLSVAYVEHWHGMELLLCLGDDQVVAIRLDILSSPVLVGMDEELKTMATGDPSNTVNIFDHHPTVFINRFQLLPVDLRLPIKRNGSAKMGSRVLCGAGTEPPALLQMYTEVDDRSRREQGLLVMPTFVGISEKGSIVTSTQEMGRVAQIPVQQDNDQNYSLLRSAWGYVGQGWSLFGAGIRVYFLCWEGATANRGISFLQQLPGSPEGIHSSRCVASVVPYSNLVKAASTKGLDAGVQLPFKKTVEESGINQDIHEDPDSTGLLAEAMQSISSIRLDTTVTTMSPSGTQENPSDLLRLSHGQKSERLLRHLSSWTQLEDTDDNREWLDRHVPVVTIKSGRDSSTLAGSLSVLSMRQVVIENGAASPFSQVLGWLSQKQDYFTAASIALDLLRDPGTLYHLWKHAEKIDEEDEQTKLKGLLDGIMPVKTTEDDDKGSQSLTTATWTQLADMTVGCLVKGGLAMSKTLILFLQTNRYYDPARASLMLVAALANTVSGDEGAVTAAMGSPTDVSFSVHDFSIQELLWPMQCLLEIGVARNYLKMTLNLINATIPDELRRRPRQGSGMTLPSLDLTKAMVTRVVSCDRTGARLLLDLPSEESSSTFWDSLDSETQQSLALIEIGQKYPMLIQEEVRGWARKQLHVALMGGENEDAMSLSTEWLRELATACLFNAGCDLQDFILDPTNISMMSIGSENSTVWTDLEMDGEDGLYQHKLKIVETRSALEPSPGSSGLDFDVLISCLLLLQSRRATWRERKEKFVSTQSLLDAACYLAGRPASRSEESLLTLDGKTLMEECVLSGNVRAGANLIGGKNGFVLSCCNILMLELQVSMEDAEAFFLSESLDTGRTITQESSKFQPDRFELSESHRQLLWLLDEYVLSIRTYGEFESTHYSRGQVDPVFAARSIFRAWLGLTFFCKRRGSEWICRWLVGRLGLQTDGTGRHRLACAAIVRALLWPSDGHEFGEESTTPDSLLGHVLEMDKKFLIQLAKSSCGLVESIPPPIADGLIGLADATQELSTSLASVRFNRTV